jgi:hypothetical protein
MKRTLAVVALLVAGSAGVTSGVGHAYASQDANATAHSRTANITFTDLGPSGTGYWLYSFAASGFTANSPLTVALTETLDGKHVYRSNDMCTVSGAFCGLTTDGTGFKTLGPYAASCGGTMVLTYTVTDGSGNRAKASFTYTC